MNIEIPRSELLPALGAVSGVVERRQTMAILGNLLLRAEEGQLLIRGTDLELEIGATIPVDIQTPGEITLPARKFVDICRSLPEDARIQIKLNGERALVSSGRSRFTLGTLPAANFPSMELGDTELRFEAPAEQLKRVLEKTAFAMASQDVRYYLNGLLLELDGQSLIAVATDGHRLAKLVTELKTEVPTEGEVRQVIVPAKTVMELKRLLPSDDQMVQVELSSRTLRVSFDSRVLSSKLVDGRYPEYGRVIPMDLPRTALIEKERLRAALQRTAILSSEKYKGVRVSFGQNSLGLQAHNPEKEVAEDEIEIDYKGEDVAVGFNIGYLLDVLQVVEPGEVEVCFSDGDSSAVWRGQGAESETYVVMPMRL